MPDDLHRPIDFGAAYGAGKRRAVVLGGGGVVFVAWLTAYLSELARRGVDVQQADLVVGTSAGSVLASVVAGGHLERVEKMIGLAAHRPAVIHKLAPSTGLHDSQQRALDLFATAKDCDPATIRAIGTAAMAARTPPVNLLPTGVLALTQRRTWPGTPMAVSGVDTYTGERLVATRESGVPLLRAVAASSSVPGLFAPQPWHDRRVMDGGVSGTGIHADLAAGASRVFLLPLVDQIPEARMTISPGAAQAEVAGLRSAGSEVELRCSGITDLDTLMDPNQVPRALTMGREQGAADAASLRDFWTG
ncbi:MAG: patatin-like phospholipase family protein [Acidimicrobiia bacterium]